jgi:hypothetical protein
VPHQLVIPGRSTHVRCVAGSASGSSCSCSAPVTNPVVSSERLVWPAACLILVTVVTTACISGKCDALIFFRVHFRATTRVVGQIVVFFAFVRDVLVKCTDVSDERTLSIFKLTKLLTVNAAVIQWNKCVICIRRVEVVWQITAAGGK